MKSSSGFILFFLGVLVAVNITSCKKITQDQLINGLWRLNNVAIDTSTSNFLNTLPHYTDGNDCCAYKLDFEKDNTVIAYYINYNNFERIVAGHWQVTDYNEVFIQVDSFMDGTFKITQPGIKKRKLTSNQNHIKAFDGTGSPIDTAKTVIDIEKI